MLINILAVTNNKNKVNSNLKCFNVLFKKGSCSFFYFFLHLLYTLISLILYRLAKKKFKSCIYFNRNLNTLL